MTELAQVVRMFAAVVAVGTLCAWAALVGLAAWRTWRVGAWFSREARAASWDTLPRALLAAAWLIAEALR